MTELSLSENHRGRTVQLTATHGLFLLIMVIAATLRFGYLGELPLRADEAQQALLAWQFWQPSDPGAATVVSSPAYVTFSAIVFALFGASDAMARLAPALFGLATVALPWLWRARLGEVGALAVSAMIAVSPTMNLVSATASGDAMALAAAVLLFVSWMRFRDKGQDRWLVVAAGALAFGLATSALFYSSLLTLTGAWLIQRSLGFPDAPGNASDGSGLTSDRGRQALLTGAACFVMVATFFLWRSVGLGDAAAQFGVWLSRFSLQGGLRALALPYLALGRYELLVVALGAVAIFWASRRGFMLPLLTVYWFALAILLTIVQWGVVSNVLVLVIPSYFLIGLLLQRVFLKPATQVRWLLVLTLLALGAIAYFNGARYLRIMTSAPQQLSFLFLAFVALAAGAVAVNLARNWDRAAAYQGTVTGLLLLFMIFNWGTSRWMLVQGGNDPREYWVDSAADDDLRMLAQLIREVSWQSTGSPHDATILAAVDTPSLRWYLREFPNAIFGQTIPPGAGEHVIITEAGETVLAPGEDYLGADLTLERSGALQPPPAPLTITDTLRWWIFHEHPAAFTAEKIILWVRNDVLLR